VVLGGALRLSADVALPLGAGDWVFTAATGTSLASLDAFDALVGGSTRFAAVLPGGLGALQQFTVGSLRLVVDRPGRGSGGCRSTCSPTPSGTWWRTPWSSPGSPPA
jgi:hypothetical protein